MKIAKEQSMEVSISYLGSDDENEDVTLHDPVWYTASVHELAVSITVL
jgi:hypothetical protein